MDGGMERKLLNLWVNRISVMVASVMVSRLKSYVVQVDLAQPDKVQNVASCTVAVQHMKFFGIL